uniref:Uncharacterized protein n=1 Tax=Arundo donax TaxID=35708 RepID=A0A0A9TS71_ARUDO
MHIYTQQRLHIVIYYPFILVSENKKVKAKIYHHTPPGSYLVTGSHIS